MRLIKRYPNRKLYDTTTRHYITLKILARLVEEGEEIKVIDSRTGDDITSKILAQLLVVEQEERGLNIALNKVRELLKTGEDILQSSMQKISLEAEKTVGRPIIEVRQLLETFTGNLEEFQRKWEAKLEDLMKLIKKTDRCEDKVKQLNKEIADLQARVKYLEGLHKKGDKDEC